MENVKCVHIKYAYNSCAGVGERPHNQSLKQCNHYLELKSGYFNGARSKNRFIDRDASIFWLSFDCLISSHPSIFGLFFVRGAFLFSSTLCFFCLWRRFLAIKPEHTLAIEISETEQCV